jgi:hypothetical protein
MSRRLPPILGLVGALALAMPASAGEVACRIERGVLVVSAQAAGLTGAFVLDAGAAQSVLDWTQMTEASIDARHTTAIVRFAGEQRTIPMAIDALDARTRTQPTPITGVLGADMLEGRVLTVWPAPCRVRLDLAAPPVRALAILPVERRGGAVYVQAGVSDGASSRLGAFRVATGEALPVRVSARIARAEGGAKGAKDPTGPLRALSLGGRLIENPQAGLDVATDGEGAIGEAVWAGYGLQLDLKHNRLVLFDPTQQKARRRVSGGP